MQGHFPFLYTWVVQLLSDWGPHTTTSCTSEGHTPCGAHQWGLQTPELYLTWMPLVALYTSRGISLPLLQHIPTQVCCLHCCMTLSRRSSSIAAGCTPPQLLHCVVLVPHTVLCGYQSNGRVLQLVGAWGPQLNASRAACSPQASSLAALLYVINSICINSVVYIKQMMSSLSQHEEWLANMSCTVHYCTLASGLYIQYVGKS